MTETCRHTRTWIGSFGLACALLWPPVPLFGGESASSRSPGDAATQPDHCYAKLRDQKDRRKSGVTVERLAADLRYGPITKSLSLVRFEFPELDIDAVSYSCRQAKTLALPAHMGLAWLVQVPPGTKIATELAESGRDSQGTAGTLLDGFPAMDVAVERSRVLLSGPFWRVGRFREEPIGLVVRQGQLLQPYEPDFSATQVLCANAADYTLSLLASHDHANIDRAATEACSTAIQVGPAFFEASSELGRVGIGATSTYESRRNLVALLKDPDPNSTEGGRTVLLSTITDISAFDTMVLVDAIADQLFDGSAVRWAVGLVDDESLLGPVLLTPGRTPLRLTQTNLPTAAILVFDWPE